MPSGKRDEEVDFGRVPHPKGGKLQTHACATHPPGGAPDAIAVPCEHRSKDPWHENEGSSTRPGARETK
jgi:hypothetical protein